MARQPYTEVADVPPEDGAEPLVLETAHPQQKERPEPVAELERPSGNGMAKRIVGVIFAVLVVYFCYLGYQHYKLTAAESGAIHSDDLPSKPSSDESASDSPPPRPRTPVVQSTMPQTTAAAAPASDSISPNPANGMSFSGSGKYQVYRQGNLTWRVDTETGATCILFATMEEWRKNIVYSHGCRNS